MKEKIRVRFVDFWVDYNKVEGNYFCELLSPNYEIEISENPEIVFYSNFGKEHLNYKCIRIFYSTENIRPDFTICDFAIGFDYNHGDNYFRLPLWMLYYLGHIKQNPMLELDKPIDGDLLMKQWKEKEKFCCFIVSNPSCEKRNHFFKVLNEVKRVDSAGKYLNNIGYELAGGTYEKLAFIRAYKFVISFENSSYPGYTTEKILEPLLAGSIPIYWGDPMVQKEFNPRRVINYDDFKTEADLIKRILEIEADPELAFSIIKEKSFVNPGGGIATIEKQLKEFLMAIVLKRKQIKPKAKSVFNNTRHQWGQYLNKSMRKVRSFLKQTNKYGTI